MNLEELLKSKVPSQDKDQNPIDITPDFRMAVQSISEAGVHVIIHPHGYDGETLDFLIQGNTLTQI